MNIETELLSETEAPLDLRDVCVLCPPPTPPPKERRPTSPGGWWATVRPPGLPPGAKDTPPLRRPVEFRGVYRPSGLYAAARPVEYGLCQTHAHDLQIGSVAVHRLEAALLKISTGRVVVPLELVHPNA